MAHDTLYLLLHADGYARARPQSLGCCITTFLVGALSAINGVAGSFAEELPVLHIVGTSPCHTQQLTPNKPLAGTPKTLQLTHEHTAPCAISRV